MPLDDHVLLLQLERSYEAIEQKLDDADIDPNCPEEHRITQTEFEIEDLKTDIDRLEEIAKRLEAENQSLREKVERLEKLAWNHDHPTAWARNAVSESRPGGKLPWEEVAQESPPTEGLA